jgi:hypothetical protein
VRVKPRGLRRLKGIWARSLLEAMSCRTGPLRVERPLRGGYTGLARMIFVGLPLVRGND